MLRIRRIHLIAILAALAALLCSGPFAAARAAEKVRLQLKWYHQFQFAGYYMAQEKGYYQDEGLDVEVIEGSKVRPATKVVVSGQAEFGVGDGAELVCDRMDGSPVVAVAGVFQHTAFLILSRKDRGILKPSDLVGKSVMTVQRPADSQFYIMLRREGIDVQWPLRDGAIRVVPHTWNVDDLIEGRVDAMEAYLTTQVPALRRRGVEPAVLRPLEYGVDFYGDVLFTSEAYGGSHPDRVTAFRRASLKGWEYAMAHPAETASCILALPTANPARPSREVLLDEASAMQDLVMPPLVELGHLNPGRLERMAQIFKELGIAGDRGSLEGFIFNPSPDAEMFSRRVKLFAASLVGLAVVALTAMAWVVLLRRQVRLRTTDLERSERRARGFLEAMPDIRLISRRDGMFIDYQTHDVGNLLVPPERFLGRYPADILPPDLADRFLKTIEYTLENGGLQAMEYPLDLQERHRFFELRMVRSGSDEVLSVIREITERKEAEAHLARLAAVVEQTNEDIIFTDREGRITYVNTAFERTTGYSREEVLGKHPDFLQSGLLANEFYDELWAVVLGGNSWTGRFSNRTKGGKVILQDASIFPIRAPEGELVGYVSSQRDVTDQVELQRRLAESQKLEALGTLAGGIAHDFNNILAAIRGYTAFAMTKPLGDPTVRDDLHAVQDASNRATELVKQILSFSRRETQIKRPLMIRPIVKETLHLLRASLPATVDLRPTTFSGTFVVAEPSHIHQIVMNLCTNAAFAMCDTVGAVEIGLDEVAVDEASASRHPDLAPGKFARLRVCDTGCGMTPEVRERIFEPFFTTREEGQGTGLGLSVVHGIVKSLGGAITVQSAPGRGSTFEVYLPAVEAGAEAWKEGEAEYLKGTERILFVDDETMLTELMTRGLRQLGYRVTACKDGREAWDAFRAAPDDFDVVITDLTMPGTTGDILAREVKRMRPMRPVILCTGYSEKVSSSTPGVDEFVMKPYSMGTLTQLIRKVCSR